VRACLTLAEEAGRIKWQKPLDKLEDAMRIRLRSIFTSVGLRHSEVDKYGTMKRPAARPKAIRTAPQPLSDREVLMLGILSLWRTHSMFHFKNMPEEEVEQWVVTTEQVWAGPTDISVKMSGAGTFRVIVENLFAALSTDASRPDLFDFVKVAL
jgi:neurofibromin 1